MKRFSKRKWWHFKNATKSISLEIVGFNQNPSIYLRVDGHEREVKFHFSLFIGIWITFENFLPKSWYPTYESQFGNGTLGCEKEISIQFHNSALWWCFWKDDDYSFHKSWRKGVFNFNDFFKGKHDCIWNELERKQFVLPFFEGNYNVEVVRKQRVDTWQRWFTKKSISFEVLAGYYENGTFKAKPIPVEGKGENSWDCDEDGTYSMSFAGQPYNKQNKNCYDAALYFWNSMMQSRERYGHAKWTPKSFDKRTLETLK
jgi:hypothetical protein